MTTATLKEATEELGVSLDDMVHCRLTTSLPATKNISSNKKSP